MNASFNQTPKFIMYHLFCVDAALRPPDQSLEQIDRSNLCLSADPDVARRCLHLNHLTVADELIADLKEMRLTGLACVGLDGTSIAPDDIRSPRYRELIEKTRAAGILFFHGFPFADTYDNRLTTQFPHIKQKTHDGRYPYVGWDKVNGHPTIDYGSDEYIAFCQACIDVLAELGVQAIDYAEPDQYPFEDNGYGDSIAAAWLKATGRPLPYPTTVEHRLFLEERDQHGLRAISDYAHAHGMVDHLTESPLIHPPALVCHNFGKHSRSRMSQLSTTYHPHYFASVAMLLEKEAQFQIQPNRTLGLGCVESKSMRGWAERHAVYFGCGQGLPRERMQDALSTYIILHQMDVCFWDYGNFRNQSMYFYNRFEEPKQKYAFFKKTVRDTIDTYLALPEDYRQAVAAPDALITYAKRSDYARYADKNPTRLSGWGSLYVLGYNLQVSDYGTMLAFDEYPEVLARDGREVPLLLLDGAQEISPAFAEAIAQWFGSGKVLLTGGELPEVTKQLLQQLAQPVGGKIECTDWGYPRSADYSQATPAVDTNGWTPLRTFAGKPIVFTAGEAETGRLIYSAVPLARLSRSDLAGLCDAVPHAKLTGEMPREVVRYRHGKKTFLAIKNYGAELSVLAVTSPMKTTAILPRATESLVTEKDGVFTTELSFQPFEVRILQYEK